MQRYKMISSILNNLLLLSFIINKDRYVHSFLQTQTSHPHYSIATTRIEYENVNLSSHLVTLSSHAFDENERKHRNSKLKRFLSMIRNQKDKLKSKKSKDNIIIEKKFEVKTIDELDDYFDDKNRVFRYVDKKGREKIDYDTLLASLSVKGDTQSIGSPLHKDYVHPTLQLLHERRRCNSPLTNINQKRPDGMKIALVVEGGGMRGCVTAGMVSAIYYLGLEDTFDVIYGSSAGTVIGAYFNTRQLPWFGPEIYYDALTTSGKQFIDSKRLLRSVGLGLLDPRLLKDVVTRPKFGKPVLNLDYLLVDTLQKKKPLNWDEFTKMQQVQPLKIVASGLKSGHSVVFSLENKSFNSIETLAQSMHASCLLPGIAGPLMNFIPNDSDAETKGGKFVIGNNLKGDNVEPLADAVMLEPIPFRTAINEGATHVLVLRSRPDGVDCTGKTSIFEKMIMRRFFLHKNKLQRWYQFMRQHRHKKIYANEVIELNHFAKDDSYYNDTSSPHVMTVALPSGSPEVTRLEIRRKEIFEGVRRGFARAYDCLVEDVNERGRGEIVARQYFPDKILDYDPLKINSMNSSAFDVFLNELAAHDHDLQLSSLGMTAAQAGLPR